MWRLPPMTSRAPCASASATLLLDLDDGAFMPQRPDLASILKPCADLQRADAGGKGLGEGIGDAPLDEDAVGGKAILAGCGELGVDGDLDRFCDIGVVEDDQRRVAAELHHQPLHRWRALRGDQAADLGGAGEAHRAQADIAANASDDRCGMAGDHIEDTGGNAGAFTEFGKRQGRKRRFRGGVGDDRAAGGKRGGCLPG